MPNLRVSHVQPITMSFYGHADRDIGRRVRYFVTDLVVAEARAGHRLSLDLLTEGPSHAHRADGVLYRFHDCHQPPARLSLQRRFGRQLSIGIPRMIVHERPDVVHFHGVMQLFAMHALVAWACERAGVPLVAHDHGFREVGRVEGALSRYALARTAVVVAGNDRSAAAAEAAGVARDRIVHLPNGIDLSTFFPDDAARSPSGEAPARVIIVSRLQPEKDPLSAARALRSLALKGRTLQVTVVGDGPLRDQVARELHAPGLDARFLSGLSHGELAPLYRSSDLFVLTSTSEGFNNASQEAMACGVPVVVSDIPGLREVVGGVGALVPSRSPGATAAAIARLLDDRDAWSSARREGLALVATRSWDSVAAHAISIYERLAADGVRASAPVD